MMRARFVLFAAFLFAASHALAQQPAPAAPAAPRAPRAPAAPAPAAPAPAPPAPAIAPPPPPPAPVTRQAINVKVDLTITEDGGPGGPIRKTVTAVVGDGYNGFVREQAVMQNNPGVGPFDRLVAPLNLDAMPSILSNGKIRLICTIQYNSNQRPQADRPQTERQITTDIRQSLTLILESGKSLVVSQATDPITDRKVTVEVTATILK